MVLCGRAHPRPKIPAMARHPRSHASTRKGNYASKRVANWIKDNFPGTYREITGSRKAVSVRLAAKNVTCHSLATFTCNLSLFPLKKNEKGVLLRNLTFEVLDLDFDVIVGLPIIRHAHLTDVFSSLFHASSHGQSVSRLSCVKVEELDATSPTVMFDTQTPDETASLGTVEPAIEGHHISTTNPPVTRTHLCAVDVRRKHVSELLGHSMEANGIELDVPPAHSLLTEEAAQTKPLTFAMIKSEVRIYGPPDLQARILALLEEFVDIFSNTVGKEPAAVTPLELNVDVAKWKTNANRTTTRMQSRKACGEIQRQVSMLLDCGLIEESTASEYSQVLMVPKKPNDPELRFCLDFRRLNDATAPPEGWPIPNIPATMQRIGNHRPKFFAIMDCTSGYHQMLMAAASRIFTAFICFMGVFHWIRVPMGLKGAPAYFQRMMASIILAGLLYIACEVYLDDVLVFGKDDDTFIKNLRSVFDRFRKHNIKLKPKKCVLGADTVEYVGHTINSDGVSFSREKIDSALDLPKPFTQKEMKRFLGIANYFRDHIIGYAEMAKPLHDMIQGYQKRKRVVLRWNDAADKAFAKLQEAISNVPPLFFVDDNLPIEVKTDASDYGIGGYIYQKDVNQPVGKQERIIAIFSKSLHGAELNWQVPEKECYAIFIALTKWEYLLRDTKFTLHTDHQNLVFLKNAGSPKIQRWKYAIQEYNFDIVHIAGELNDLADRLSRACLSEKDAALATMVIAKPNRVRIPSDKYKLISAVHNSAVGHHGVEKTVQKLKKQKHTWLHRRAHVRMFIRRCSVCQLASQKKTQNHSEPFTTASYDPMDLLSIDTIGPIDEDVDGNKYIIVIICCFTRYVELFPAPAADAASAALALLQHFGRYGAPSQLRSDRGTQFVNDVIKEFTQLVGTIHSPTTPYSKEENGMVERANKEVMRHLRAIIFDKRVKAKWSKHDIPLVHRILNAEVKERIGFSPAQLLFGDAVNLDRGVILPHKVYRDEGMTEMSVYAQNLIKRQALLIQVAQETQNAFDSHHISMADPERTEFPINSYVLWKDPGDRRTKLQMPLAGPFRVVDVAENTYTLQNLVTNKTFETNIHTLHAFEYDSAVVDPAQVAQHDESEFVIERVLDHRGDRAKRSTLEFLVKWENQDDSENTWEPWCNVRLTRQLHEYLGRNRMTSLIPKNLED
mmetsp:Transcript_12868/g.21379  ORF Transcript_12868/g.21379 Transcript_12868/m.21379 type:complete len:1181 (+) Transcript_12868:947-4489(+)